MSKSNTEYKVINVFKTKEDQKLVKLVTKKYEKIVNIGIKNT